MNKEFIRDIIVSITLLVLLVLFFNPLMFWMPGTLHMMLLLATIVIFCFFAVFFWKEKAADEREEKHQLIAGRLAFLSGSAILLISVIVQNIKGAVDPWLLSALIVMVLVKFIARFFASRYQ